MIETTWKDYGEEIAGVITKRAFGFNNVFFFMLRSGYGQGCLTDLYLELS